jgi:hypothetical protein
MGILPDATVKFCHAIPAGSFPEVLPREATWLFVSWAAFFWNRAIGEATQIFAFQFFSRGLLYDQAMGFAFRRFKGGEPLT